MNAYVTSPSPVRPAGQPHESAYSAAPSSTLHLQEVGRANQSNQLNQFRVGSLNALKSRDGFRADPTASLTPAILHNQTRPPAQGQIALRFAVSRYADGTATLGQAATVAGLSQADFQFELGRRRVPVHYDSDDLREDAETIAAWLR